MEVERLWIELNFPEGRFEAGDEGDTITEFGKVGDDGGETANRRIGGPCLLISEWGLKWSVKRSKEDLSPSEGLREGGLRGVDGLDSNDVAHAAAYG